MKNFIKKWDKWEIRISGILIAISVSLAFYEVISRSVLHTSIDWSSEITLYLIIFSAILGISTLIKQDENVGVDLVVTKLNPQRQLILHFLNGCLCLLFTVVLAYSGVLWVYKAFIGRYISEATMQLPLWVPYLAMPFGGVLLSLRMLERLRSLFPQINMKGMVKDPIFFIFIFFYLLLLYLLKMNYSPTVILGFGFLVLLISGMPIAFTLGVVCFAVIYFLGIIPMAGIAAKMFESINTFSLLAIPFFILSGVLMAKGGVAEPLLNFAFEMVRPIRGGFAIAVMIACVIFAALSGVSVAISAALGMIALPTMLAKGYPRQFGVGLLAVGGTLGAVIPPSAILVLYGAISGESIGDLFKGGIVPGLIIGFAFCILIFIICKVKNYGLVGSEEGFSFLKVIKHFFKAFWALLMPVIILGGIYSGVFTPTEAAAVAVFYGIVVCSLTYKKMKMRDYLPILEESAKFNAVIYFIVMTATLFSFLVTIEQWSNNILEFVIGMDIKPWLFLLIINICVFIMGCFLHPGAIILMLVPVVYPILGKLNIDPIHFGVLLAINSELAFVTPPFGMNIFVVSSVCKAPVTEVIRGVIPFIIVLLISLLIITYFPQLSLVFVR